MSVLLLATLLACGDVETEAVVAQPAVETVAEAKADGADPRFFGTEFKIETSESVNAVLSDPKAFEGKTVRVAGEVAQVCQKAGCWMVLRGDDGQTMRITTKDHGYGVDKDCAGKVAHVEGEVVVNAVDPERVAHFKSESDAKEAPEDGKTETVEIVAASVMIEPAKG